MNRAKVTLSLIFLAGLLSLPVTGCGRQEQGERCDLENADDDCEDNEDLVCTDAARLRDGEDLVSRCCPPNLNDYSDSRCAPKQGGIGGGDGLGGEGMGGVSSSGGSNSSGGGDGTGGDNTAGKKKIGDSCNYTSDCLEDLECGPTGLCQVECVQARDCDAGQTCKENICVAQ